MAASGGPRHGPSDRAGFIEVMNIRTWWWRVAVRLGIAATVLLLPHVTAAQEQLLWVDGPAGRLRVSDGGNGGVPVVFVHGLVHESVYAGTNH